MTHQWRGIIEEYRDRLPVSDTTPVVTLREGGTPLVPAQVLSERTGCEVHLKVEGLNPTGSFKDRGMTMAISKAVEEGSRAVICASTGNTSASAAAFEIVDVLGAAPDVHCLPVGNAGNITAYWKGYTEYGARPRMLGFQAAGAAPLVHGKPVEQPETVASAIRIGNPARWEEAESAIAGSHGEIRAVSDAEILE